MVGGGGGGEGEMGARPPPPMIIIIIFFRLLFFASQLRAQSCTLMMIIPLTHYDNFATNFFQVGKKCVTAPSFTPPPFFFLLLS